MSIQDDVNRLYKAGAKRIVLSELQQRDAITEKRGIATSTPPVDNGQLTPPLKAISAVKVTQSVDIVDSGDNVIGSADVEVIQSVVLRDARGYDYSLDFSDII